MITIYRKFIFLFLLLAIVACKKGDEVEPSDSNSSGNNGNADNNNNNNGNGNNEPIPYNCLVSGFSYSSSFVYSYSYAYNSDNLISTSVYSNGATTLTKNYTYTKNGDGKVTKKDEGKGTYVNYEYSNGKLVKFSEYNSNTAGYYHILSYGNNTMTDDMYNSSGLYSKTEYTYNGENVVSKKITTYNTPNTTILSVLQYNFSDYDTKYSYAYTTAKSDPSTVGYSKNNSAKYTYTSTIYNASGGVLQSSSGSCSIAYTYNSSGATTKAVESISTTVNGVTSTSTGTYNYSFSNCN